MATWRHWPLLMEAVEATIVFGLPTPKPTAPLVINEMPKSFATPATSALTIPRPVVQTVPVELAVVFTQKAMVKLVRTTIGTEAY